MNKQLIWPSSIILMQLGCEYPVLDLRRKTHPDKYSSYDPVTETDFQRNIFDILYATTTTPSSSTRTSILSSLHSHSLAIFFLIVATGSLFGEPPFAKTVSERYYALARAAFSLKSISHESNVASVQALFMFIVFKYLTDRSTSDIRWLLGGVCFRVANTVRAPY